VVTVVVVISGVDRKVEVVVTVLSIVWVATDVPRSWSQNPSPLLERTLTTVTTLEFEQDAADPTFDYNFPRRYRVPRGVALLQRGQKR
jgi:hypothetical protein